MDIVTIKCVDMAYSTRTWSRKEMDDFSPMNLEVVGWLVEDREDCVIIANEYQPEDDFFRHVFAIPRSSIREIKKSGKNKI